MRNLLITIVLFLLSTSTALAANPAPLGLELGVATLAQARQALGGKTRLTDAGTNAYSGGRMIKGDGTGLEVEGLSEITLIFDKNDKLAAVLMTLPKQEGMSDMQNGMFKKTLATLSAKYKLVEKRVPFVGDSYAKFRQGDSIIELDAPHLSFNMNLRYLTNDLQAAFNRQSEVEKSAKQRRQASQL